MCLHMQSDVGTVWHLTRLFKRGNPCNEHMALFGGHCKVWGISEKKTGEEMACMFKMFRH